MTTLPELPLSFGDHEYNISSHNPVASDSNNASESAHRNRKRKRVYAVAMNALSLTDVDFFAVDPEDPENSEPSSSLSRLGKIKQGILSKLATKKKEQDEGPYAATIWLGEAVSNAHMALAYEIRSTASGSRQAYYTPLYHTQTSHRLCKRITDSQHLARILADPWYGTSETVNTESAEPPLPPIEELVQTLIPENTSSSSTVPSHVASQPSAAGQASPFAAGFPPEVFENVFQFLSRKDIQNVRLVSKVYEHGSSGYFFGTVVVPFSTEIYGRLAEAHLGNKLTKPDRKGKGRAILTENRASPSNDGDVFRSFGGHIRRYGMTFEVTEAELESPPTKSRDSENDVFWGAYKWPHHDYRRFTNRANLESIADETGKMKRAFSKLKNLQHLALSLDCGLGWLSGPDKSLWAKFLGSEVKLIVTPGQPENADATLRRALWQALEQSFRNAGTYDDLKFSNLYRIEGRHAQRVLDLLHNMPFSSLPERLLREATHGNARSEPGALSLSALVTPQELLQMITNPHMGFGGHLPHLGHLPHPQPGHNPSTESSSSANTSSSTDSTSLERTSPTLARCGLLVPIRPAALDRRVHAPLSPVCLDKPQLEWLLETAWAQDAFLTSWMLAVVDNASIFGNLKSLTLSRLSSRHLLKLVLPDFWNTLSGLKTLDIQVIADWRDVGKNPGGKVMGARITPSLAVDDLYYLLRTVGQKESVNSLRIGWTNGGEHASGMAARNTHILPAPLTLRNQIETPDEAFKDMLSFPHVRFLSLINCWMTPNILTAFVNAHVGCKLKELTLESVALSTHPRFDGLGQQNLAGWANVSAMMWNGANAAAHANPQQHMQQWLTQHRDMVWQWQNPHQLNTNGMREGSWPDVLRTLKLRASVRPEKPLVLHLLSCGYVRIPRARYDQSVLDHTDAILTQDDTDHIRSLHISFQERWNSLTNHMLKTADEYLGTLMGALPPTEMAWLQQHWGLHPGWPTVEEAGPEYDDHEGWGKWGDKVKEAAEHDGQRTGGSGRFSGVVERLVG